MQKPELPNRDALEQQLVDLQNRLGEHIETVHHNKGGPKGPYNRTGCPTCDNLQQAINLVTSSLSNFNNR